MQVREDKDKEIEMLYSRLKWYKEQLREVARTGKEGHVSIAHAQILKSNPEAPMLQELAKSKRETRAAREESEMHKNAAVALQTKLSAAEDEILYLRSLIKDWRSPSKGSPGTESDPQEGLSRPQPRAGLAGVEAPAEEATPGESAAAGRANGCGSKGPSVMSFDFDADGFIIDHDRTDNKGLSREEALSVGDKQIQCEGIRINDF